MGSLPFKKFGGLSLEHTECRGQRVEFRLRDEQVDVLGHDHVTEKKELMSFAKVLQCVEENRAEWSSLK
jgi:hypothetical protein